MNRSSRLIIRTFILALALALGVLLLPALWSADAQEAQPAPDCNLQLQCADPYEPNDSFTNALFLSSGVITSYVCCDVTDYDYFKFSVNAGELIRLNLYNLPADYNLCLFDPAQNQMACSSNGGTITETIEETATSSGDHYALVYGNQGACDSANPYTFELAKQGPPDLTVNGVWEENGDICYQVQNIGEQTAPAGHVTDFSIDGQSRMTETVEVDLAAGERLNRCLGYGWQCSPPSDVLIVRVDVQNSVAESDETNNAITETWACDTTPPKIISGPVASNVLTSSATITWTTDEASDSVVKFGRYAGEYEYGENNAQSVTDHEIHLTGLQPATVYHYLVESSDGAGNTVVGPEGFFETGVVSPSAPSLSSLTISRVGGQRELYEITVSVADPQSTRKVEFYLDGVLIGSDYAADPPSGALNASGIGAAASEYRAYLDPAAVKLSRTGFFSTTHTVRARAFGLGGLTRETSTFYMPAFEPPDIDLRVWPRYDLTRYVDGVGGTLPAETVNVSVHASEDEWECSWVPLTGDLHCADVEHAVERVEFEIDDVVVHTWYPSGDDDLDHVYGWEIGGLGVGSYHLEVRAYARAGGSLGAVRTLNVVQGTPSLDLTRSVTREGNYFRVRLTLENDGTGSAGVSHIRDNVSGLQAIMTDTTNYTVVPEYWVETKHCDVEIDVFTGTEALMIGPGESLVVEYLAVPILYDDSDTFAYGAGVRDEVKIWDQGDFCRWRFDRPEPLEAEVGRAREVSDYLIVTHPRNLFRTNAGRRDDVDELLSTMAELARLKSGLLGYVLVWNAEDVRGQIQAWGSGMRGSDGVDDHFLSNGYVLLVGEAEILGSWESTHKLWIDRKLRTRTVHYTDLPYGNTSGDWMDPELIVGRVVGNNARELMVPIQTSINAYRNEPGHRFTKDCALLVSGRGRGVSDFEQDVDDISRHLRTLGSDFNVGCVDTKKQRLVEDVDGLDMTWVFTTEIGSTFGRDLLLYSDHCNAFTWSGVIEANDFPINFWEKSPFAFALCCQSGRYEDLGATGITEAFLQNGAGVYIGATENSYSGPDHEAGTWFFDRWADRSESIGQSLKALKRHLDGRWGWYWAAEYNLYGDPKYGALPTIARLAAHAEITTTELITWVSIVVPDYEVTSTLEGEHRVHIPDGGGMLLEEGKPAVPVFYTEIEYAPGYRVQDVVLTARSGLTTATGLVISTTTMISKPVSAAPSLSTNSGEEWWPELDQVYDWTIQDHPDGSSTLVVKLYPFYYDAATTNVRFYKNYSFTVQVISSTVQVTALSTDESAYAQGDDVTIDLTLENGGDAQDVIVSAVVETQAGDVVDGLLLQSLTNLTGTASFALQWDSAGFDPGYYAVEAEIRDTAGNLLDRKVREFRVGVWSGEVTALTATPAFFHAGDAISVSLVFSNTGTVPLTGTAVVQVRDDAGGVVKEFRHAVADLAAAHSIGFDDVWDTSGADEGSYAVVGYVLYDSRATDIETVTVSTETYIYLPVILKGK